jgi:hypothetical protein
VKVIPNLEDREVGCNGLEGCDRFRLIDRNVRSGAGRLRQVGLENGRASICRNFFE